MNREIDRILIPQQRIAERVKELAEQIMRDHSPPRVAEGEVTIVPVMTGAMIFCADLIRQMSMAMKIGLIAVSSYPGAATESRGARLIAATDPAKIRNRHILLLDDILDSGGTLRAVTPALAAMSPASVRTCVLLRKIRATHPGVRADYVGFDIPDEFVVGYGLDYDDYYRNIPDIVTLRP